MKWRYRHTNQSEADRAIMEARESRKRANATVRKTKPVLDSLEKFRQENHIFEAFMETIVRTM